jgi:methionyl aminopeptidase
MSLGRRVRIKTDEEVELIRLSSLLVGRTLAEVAARVQPGVTTLELDAVAEAFIRDHGPNPASRDTEDFRTRCACR